jgi:hypothetical protein
MPGTGARTLVCGREVTEEDVYRFIRDSIGSVWALELLLLLRRGNERLWRSEELVRELRSSNIIVNEALTRLMASGLVAERDGGYEYRPASPLLSDLVEELQRVYAAKPVTVIKAIMAAPNEKLRIFSNAFKLKD